MPAAHQFKIISRYTRFMGDIGLDQVYARFRDLHTELELENACEHSEQFYSAEPFYTFFRSLDKVKKLPRIELVKRSGIERTYCYQILNGRKRRPGRDKIIRLCLSAGLSIEETNRALCLSGEAVLFPRIRRDAILVYTVSHHYSVNETMELLDRLGEEVLT